MAASAILWELNKLRQQLPEPATRTNPTLETIRKSSDSILSLAGYPPDPWQQQLLRHPARETLLLCSRQAGKSTVSAALALRTAFLEAPALVLLLSPSLRQSKELFVKVMDIYRRLGRPVPTTKPKDNSLDLTLRNGSRVISLPGNEETIRCYSSVTLLIVDEASRVPDDLMGAIRPMLAVSRGRIICLSTPNGRRGFFYDAWTGSHPYHRVKITADQVPRISPEFLEAERRNIGERFFRQEYLCEFTEMTGACFRGDDIDALLMEAVPAMAFPELESHL